MIRFAPVCVVLGVGLLAARPSFAHAFLQSSEPAVGGSVAHPPTAVRITYTEDVEPRFSGIAVTNGTGADMAAGRARLAPGAPATLVLPLKALSPGTYAVTWHVTSVDTHKTKGGFTFTVTP